MTDAPIFIFGMGRSGSTFLQHQLCQADGVWIWGEHRGFLEPLARAYRLLEDSDAFARYAPLLLGRAVGGIASHESTAFAWINSLTLGDLKDTFRENLRSWFASNLPEGKSRWGFKEIRYGAEDRVPEFLHSLFPEARSVYGVRHPRRTIESALSAWRRERVDAVLEGNRDAAEAMRASYRTLAKRWQLLAQNFLQREERGDRVMVLPVERFTELAGELENFLSVKLSSSAARLTNSGGFEVHEGPLGAIFADEWHSARDVVGELATRLGYGVD